MGADRFLGRHPAPCASIRLDLITLHALGGTLVNNWLPLSMAWSSANFSTDSAAGQVFGPTVQQHPVAELVDMAAGSVAGDQFVPDADLGAVMCRRT